MKNNARIARQLVRLARELSASGPWSSDFPVKSHLNALKFINDPDTFRKNISAVRDAIKTHISMIKSIADGNQDKTRQCLEHFMQLARNFQILELVTKKGAIKQNVFKMTEHIQALVQPSLPIADYERDYRSTAVSVVVPLRNFYWLLSLGKQIQSLFEEFKNNAIKDTIEEFSKRFDLDKNFVERLALGPDNYVDQIMSDIADIEGMEVSEDTPNAGRNLGNTSTTKFENLLNVEKLVSERPIEHINTADAVLRQIAPKFNTNYNMLITYQKKLDGDVKRLLAIHYSVESVLENKKFLETDKKLLTMLGLQDELDQLTVGISPSGDDSKMLKTRQDQVIEGVPIDLSDKKKSVQVKENLERIRSREETLQPTEVPEPQPPAAKPPRKPSAPAGRTTDDTMRLLREKLLQRQMGDSPTASTPRRVRMKSAGILGDAAEWFAGTKVGRLCIAFLDKIKAFFGKKEDEIARQGDVCLEDARKLEECYRSMVGSLEEAGFDVSMFLDKQQ